MTYRELHGLCFKAWSPSNYELVTDKASATIGLVSVAYTGEGWNINVLMKQGPTVVRGPYSSFAHACEVLAFGQARARA